MCSSGPRNEPEDRFGSNDRGRRSTTSATWPRSTRAHVSCTFTATGTRRPCRSDRTLLPAGRVDPHGPLPDNDDPEAAVTEVIETPPPCWAVGRYWSDQVLRGFKALPDLDRAQYLQVRFEDLLRKPATVVSGSPSSWTSTRMLISPSAAAALGARRPHQRFGDLDPDEQAELRGMPSRSSAARPSRVTPAWI